MYQKYTIHTTSNTTIYHNHHYQFHEYVLPLICTPPSVLWPGPNGIENFQTRDFRDRILQNPRIFQDRISLKFLSRDLTEKCGYGQISQTIWLQMENFVVAILYLVYFALKYMYFEDLSRISENGGYL